MQIGIGIGVGYGGAPIGASIPAAAIRDRAGNAIVSRSGSYILARV